MSIASAMMAGVTAAVKNDTKIIEQQQNLKFRQANQLIDNYLSKLVNYESEYGTENLLKTSVFAQMKSAQIIKTQQNQHFNFQNSNDSRLRILNIIQEGYRTLMNVRTLILGEENHISYNIMFADAGGVFHEVEMMTEEYLGAMQLAENGLSMEIDTASFEQNLNANKYTEYSGTDYVSEQDFYNFYKEVTTNKALFDKLQRDMYRRGYRYSSEYKKRRSEFNKAYRKNNPIPKGQKMSETYKQNRAKWVEQQLNRFLEKSISAQSEVKKRIHINTDEIKKVNQNPNFRKLASMFKMGRTDDSVYNYFNNGFLYEAIKARKRGEYSEMDIYSTYRAQLGNKAFYRGGDVGNTQLKFIQSGFTAHGVNFNTIMTGFLELKYAFTQAKTQSQLEEATALVLTGSAQQAQVAEANIIAKLQAMLG